MSGFRGNESSVKSCRIHCVVSLPVTTSDCFQWLLQLPFQSAVKYCSRDGFTNQEYSLKRSTFLKRWQILAASVCFWEPLPQTVQFSSVFYSQLAVCVLLLKLKFSMILELSGCFTGVEGHTLKIHLPLGGPQWSRG